MIKKNGEADDTTEEKDTTSTEETNDDSSDDEEDSSSKSRSDSTNDDDSEDDEDISKKYFTDPKSIEPKIRGAFKKMQGQYTRKMQELSQGIEKSRAFDQLILDPDFRAWMEQRKGNRATNKQEIEQDDDNGDDEDAPLTRKALKSEIAKALEPIRKDREDEKRERYQQQLRQQADIFRKANPDWEIYKHEIIDLMNSHPTLTYKQAYKLAIEEDEDSPEEKDSMDRKRKGNISKPSKTSAKDVEEKKGKMSIMDAYHAAKKKLKL